MGVPEKLQAIAQEVRNTGEPHTATVRELLRLFNAERRGHLVVRMIRNGLEEAGVRTEPDFEGEFIGNEIDIVAVSPGESRPPSGLEEPPTGEGSESGGGIEDPGLTVGQLPTANKPKALVKVSRDKTVAEAATLMLAYDYSQLPVMQNDRDIDGMISWRSIGRARAKRAACEYVRDCLEEAESVRWNTPLLAAVPKIAENDAVLVRGRDRSVTGIVTASDLSSEFRALAEPFFLLEEIEKQIRRLIDGKFEPEELAAAQHPPDEGREVEGADDLTLGEYHQLLGPDDHWERLDFDLDRTRFRSLLDDVRTIRNKVMHFSPDPLSTDDLAKLGAMRRLLAHMH